MADVMSRDLAVGRLRTRVLDTGPLDASEAVVLIHGAPGSADAWASLQPAVGEFARAVAFDLPGYGNADAPKTLTTPWAHTGTSSVRQSQPSTSSGLTW